MQEGRQFEKARPKIETKILNTCHEVENSDMETTSLKLKFLILDDMDIRIANKYRLGRKIGGGSFGDIYLGKQNSSECLTFIMYFVLFLRNSVMKKPVLLYVCVDFRTREVRN